VELLRLVPDSVEARIRLHDYLTDLKANMMSYPVSEKEVEVLVEASAENSLAKEILKKYYSHSGRWGN